MKKIGAGLLALAMLSAAPAAAQEADEEPASWTAEAGLTLQASGGNEDLAVFTATAAITHLEADVYELAGDARFRYGESEGQRVAENLSG